MLSVDDALFQIKEVSLFKASIKLLFINNGLSKLPDEVIILSNSLIFSLHLKAQERHIAFLVELLSNGEDSFSLANLLSDVFFQVELAVHALYFYLAFLAENDELLGPSEEGGKG